MGRLERDIRTSTGVQNICCTTQSVVPCQRNENRIALALDTLIVKQAIEQARRRRDFTTEALLIKRTVSDLNRL